MKIKARQTRIGGTLSVPGSKSHTIRAGIFAALAEGTSTIRNPLPSADCKSCMAAIQAFGAKVEMNENEWTVTGTGGNLKQPGCVVDVGNSGSTLYFAAGVASAVPGWTVFTGDSSICTRPIRELINGLKQLGADGFTTRDSIDAPPALIKGPIKAGKAVIAGRLSQYVSAMIIAATLTKGKTRLELTDPKEKPFVKMTIDWLASLGIPVAYDEKGYSWIEISGRQKYPRFDRAIPSDWEGVAFPLVAAIITGSELRIQHIDCSGSQGDAAITDVLKSMGADITIDEKKEELVVKGGRPLCGVTVDCSDFPDAVPVLAVAACFAAGTTRLTDIGVCRLKETDRITLMKVELEKLGAEVEEGPDYLAITGGRALRGGTLNSHHDHRIAMALSVAGLAVPGDGVIVTDAECCNVSFPGFYEIMNRVGAGFTEAS